MVLVTSYSSSPVKTIACRIGLAWLSVFVLLKRGFSFSFLTVYTFFQKCPHFGLVYYTYIYIKNNKNNNLQVSRNCSLKRFKLCFQTKLWNAGCHFNSTTTFQLSQGIQQLHHFDTSNSQITVSFSSNCTDCMCRRPRKHVTMIRL